MKNVPVTEWNVLDTIRNEIQAEHVLVSHRVSWLVMSQAFLMTAYTIASGKDNRVYEFTHGWLPALGIVMSALAFVGILAAVRVQSDLIGGQARFLNDLKCRDKDLSDRGKNNLQRYAETTAAARPTQMEMHWLAMMPPLILPAVFIGLWIVSYVYQASEVKSPPARAQLVAQSVAFETISPVPNAQKSSETTRLDWWSKVADIASPILVIAGGGAALYIYFYDVSHKRNERYTAVESRLSASSSHSFQLYGIDLEKAKAEGVEPEQIVYLSSLVSVLVVETGTLFQSIPRYIETPWRTYWRDLFQQEITRKTWKYARKLHSERWRREIDEYLDRYYLPV